MTKRIIQRVLLGVCLWISVMYLVGDFTQYRWYGELDLSNDRGEWKEDTINVVKSYRYPWKEQTYYYYIIDASEEEEVVFPAGNINIRGSLVIFTEETLTLSGGTITVTENIYFISDKSKYPIKSLTQK